VVPTGGEPAGPDRLLLPADAVVMLVGPSGSGKSTWASRYFGETEIVSSDRCRALVADTEASQRASPHAFAVFYEILGQRVALGRLSVADSTGLSPHVRERIREIAYRGGAPVYVIVFAEELEVALRRNASRSRRVPVEVVARQVERLSSLLREGTLEREGYAGLCVVRSDRPAPVPVRPSQSPGERLRPAPGNCTTPPDPGDPEASSIPGGGFEPPMGFPARF
jgi:predicted kinase